MRESLLALCRELSQSMGADGEPARARSAAAMRRRGGEELTS